MTEDRDPSMLAAERLSVGRHRGGGTVTRASTGTCELCKQQTSKSQMTRHVAQCAPEHDASGGQETIVQLRIDADGDPRYWLYVEARASASLQQLDSLIRRTWLECCGHLSAFWAGRSELAMGTEMGSAFPRKRVTFSYEYDFGSTTALKGHVVGTRNGCLGRAAVRLLARNDPFDWRCANCSRPAVIVCPFCIPEDDCLFCEAHAQEHPCAEEEVYLPVVNSPRMGVCGYVG